MQSHCNHFVLRKKRFCRISPLPEGKFCAEHQPLSDTTTSVTGTKIRIVCPLDPKHTCYANNLTKHLKICNARPKEAPSYITKGVNCGKNTINSTHKPLSSYPINEIKELVQKIEAIYTNLDVKIKVRLETHNLVEEEMTKPEYGSKTKKHLIQASAILGLVKSENLLGKNTIFIEFGAGRGQLSWWLSQAAPDSAFLLIERASPKHKKDNKVDAIERIKADIADLVLDKIDSINKNEVIVGVTKHLCGDASDLALRCLGNISVNKSKLAGIIMTFCCHHRCNWGNYTGAKLFESIKLTQCDFDMMCGISSWATCGSGLSRERKNTNISESLNDRDKEIGLTKQQKEEIGRKCKIILNWGRLKYLEEFGFQCNLFYYVGSDVSLENVCIVARKL